MQKQLKSCFVIASVLLMLVPVSANDVDSAESNGFRDLQSIGAQAREKLVSGGWLLLEHGYAQHETLLALLRGFGYIDVEGKKDLAGVPRMVQARWPGPISD